MIIPFPYPINLIIISLLNVLGISLALWVYWANRLNNVNRGFFLMVFCILGWVDFYFLAQINNSTLWYRLSAASVFLFFVAYYFFVVIWFLKKEKTYKKIGILILFYGFSLSILSITTNTIISNSKVIGYFLVKPVLSSIGWWLFYGFVFTITVMVNWILLREYSKYSKANKFKIQYFLVGLLVFAGFNFVFNVIFPAFLNNYELYELGNYSIVFFLFFTAYATVKHNLFDIRILLSQILVVIILIILVIRIAISTNFQDLIINIFLTVLVFAAVILLLRSISKEKELTFRLLEETKKTLDLEKQLREKITRKTDEMIKKMEDIVGN